VQQVGIKFYTSCDRTSLTWGEGGGELLHILFLDLLIYSQLFHTYSIRQEMDDYKQKSAEKTRVYLWYYTNIHHKKK
jgi:hypothetical protein